MQSREGIPEEKTAAQDREREPTKKPMIAYLLREGLMTQVSEVRTINNAIQALVACLREARDLSDAQASDIVQLQLRVRELERERSRSW